MLAGAVVICEVKWSWKTHLGTAHACAWQDGAVGRGPGFSFWDYLRVLVAWWLIFPKVNGPRG